MSDSVPVCRTKIDVVPHASIPCHACRLQFLSGGNPKISLQIDMEITDVQ